MPTAHKNHKEEKDGTYYYIYNHGVENRNIFNSKEDYQTFVDYLQEYLTAPQDPESVKKVFTIKGRVFRGVPRQPKNYFGKVDLIAYSLTPNSFHLLLQQKTKNSITHLMRSLATRYSIYFNKKCNRTGTLFQGPYKSVQIEDGSSLLFLSRYFHRSKGYSSYPEYLGERETDWVKSQVVLTLFEKSQNNLLKGVHSYKNFVEEYIPTQNEEKLLETIIPEHKVEQKHEQLENKDQSPTNSLLVPINNQASPKQTDNFLKPHQRIPEIMATVGLFLLLLGLGIRNIEHSTANTQTPLSTTVPQTLGVNEEEFKPPLEQKPESLSAPSQEVLKPEDESELPEAKSTLVVKITDESESVNIRQQPSVQSEIIAKALKGDNFSEFALVNSNWYEIKLPDGSTGYISARYTEIKKEE